MGERAMNEAIDPKKIRLHEDAETSGGHQLARRRDIQKIISSPLFRLGAPFAVLSALAISGFTFKLGSTEKTTVWSFVVSMTAIGVLIIIGQFIITEFRALTDKIREGFHASSAKTKDEITQIVRENLDSHVTVLTGLPDIRAEAGKLLQEVVQKKHEVVHFFGAGNLTPSEQELREASDSENSESSDIVRYQNALEDLKNGDVKITRFVWLLDDGRFQLREPKTRESYLKWLQYQVAHLKVNPNYTLYDARRAPEWGGPRSSILTTSRQLDILGDGRVGLLVISARIPDVFRHASTKYFWEAGPNNKPQSYTTDNVNKLQVILDRQTGLHRDLLASKGKSGKGRASKGKVGA
jgi:hypothetical protein